MKKAIEDKDGEIVKARSESNYPKKLLRLEEEFVNKEKKLKVVEKEL